MHIFYLALVVGGWALSGTSDQPSHCWGNVSKQQTQRRTKIFYIM